MIVSPIMTLIERNHRTPDDATLQADKNPIAMRPLESLSDKYQDDKLTKPVTGLAIKYKAGHKLRKMKFVKVDIHRIYLFLVINYS